MFAFSLGFRGLGTGLVSRKLGSPEMRYCSHSIFCKKIESKNKTNV